MKREHLRPQQRSHYVVVDGGEQPQHYETYLDQLGVQYPTLPGSAK